MHPFGLRPRQSPNGEVMAKDRGKDNETLSLKKICRRAHEFAAPFRIDDGRKFRLKDDRRQRLVSR